MLSNNSPERGTSTQLAEPKYVSVENLDEWKEYTVFFCKDVASKEKRGLYQKGWALA